MACMLEHIMCIVMNEDNMALTQTIYESQIFVAIWSLGPNKAPRSNGFTISLYMHYWDLKRHDLKQMLHYTHQSLRLGGNTNSCFLALIPKEVNPTSFSRFWPISLCNSAYKILTKTIASQLKRIMPKIISPNQGGFMHDRQIMDNIVLV